MATLEFINYIPQRHIFSKVGSLEWEDDPNQGATQSLPMIFWKDGTPWNEANHWAHERAACGYVDVKTVQNQMSHLHKYAQWLEISDSPDWRHFPMNRSERVLVKWRKFLIDCRDKHSVLAPTTATARMNACISFYRHCSTNGFIGSDTPTWKDISVTIKYYNTVGFKRTVSRLTTDISIKCRVSKGATVEGGLLPITSEHMGQLLEFSKLNSSAELILMLKLGFFTGARVQTICSLNIKNLERAVPDSEVPGLWHVAVGPGSQPHVETKFNVSGNLLVPELLLNELKTYAYSTRRMKREANAPLENKGLLFITSCGNPYERRQNARCSSAINSEMVILRRTASSAGLKFMSNFYFHQTRATYGTQLMRIILPLGNLQASLEFVRTAMFHKEISTTMTYVKFIEQTKAKMEAANAYNHMFFGLANKLGYNNE